MLVRHGETPWTRARRVIGRRPVGLSDRGRAEARALVPLLAPLEPALIVTSPLVRARETAEIVRTALARPLAVDDDLAELDFGTWEGRSYDELLADPAYLAFSRDPDRAPPPAGERGSDAHARALGAVGRALTATSGACVCLVTHGDLIRLLLAGFLGLERAAFRRLRIDTGGLSGVELTGDFAEVRFTNLLADPARLREALHWRPAPDALP